MTTEVKQLDDRTEYLKDGLLHREGDLPAVEWKVGEWKQPSIPCANGFKSWYKHGKLHRETGPAMEWVNGDKSWYVNGIQLTEEEFNKRYGFDRYEYVMGLI